MKIKNSAFYESGIVISTIIIRFFLTNILIILSFARLPQTILFEALLFSFLALSFCFPAFIHPVGEILLTTGTFIYSVINFGFLSWFTLVFIYMFCFTLMPLTILLFQGLINKKPEDTPNIEIQEPTAPPTTKKNLPAIISALLIVSLIINGIFFYQHNVQQETLLALADLYIQQETELTKTQTALENRQRLYTVLEKSMAPTKAAASKATEESKALQLKLNWYYNNVALMNTSGNYGAYHRIDCTALNETFYIKSLNSYLRATATPCPLCQ